MIVRLSSRSDWERAQADGVYAPRELEDEGFIHLSGTHQVHIPANELYSDRADLVLLWIEPSRLTAELRDETFPHLYGELNLDAVVGISELAPWKPGAFVLPAPPP